MGTAGGFLTSVIRIPEERPDGSRNDAKTAKHRATLEETYRKTPE